MTQPWAPRLLTNRLGAVSPMSPLDSVLTAPARVPLQFEAAQPAHGPIETVETSHWLRTYARAVLIGDVVALALAGCVALLARFGQADASLGGLPYPTVVLLLGGSWLGVLAVSRCYEPRFLGNGTEEFKRVGNASIRLTAVVALFCYATQVEVARGFVAVVLPVGFALLMLGRYAGRLVLLHHRRRGRCSHRVVVVGNYEEVLHLIEQMRREPMAGLDVVGACVPGGLDFVSPAIGLKVPVVSGIAGAAAALVGCRADTVAVAASSGISGEALRGLSYELEGSGVYLLVAPALTNITGTRISIRPIAGLPLLHVDEPELAGARKLLKSVFDRSVALVALVLVSPLLIALGLAVRLTSAGPAIFKQERVGRGGETFRVWKLRSMYGGAELRQHELAALNELEGTLFKIRKDPRVTGLGQFLRRYSLDELPQLINVLRGDMSLVGPRPPLAREVACYEGFTGRRLLVKPGMTGLWQVSGRSDLSWDETVRLDLHYVENWSLGLDLTILAKTGVAVLKGRGAY